MEGAPAPGQVTALLQAWRSGDESAGDGLFRILYRELRGTAARVLRREGRHQTLHPTALVHEAFLRLVRQRVPWRNRAHFLGIAAQAMRRVVVDRARRRRAGKRAAPLVAFDEALVAGTVGGGVDVLALNDALSRLEALDARQARIVEMRFFAGLSVEETAAALSISPATVKREWVIARAWLRRELRGPAAGSAGEPTP